jgi:hypothetical protein
VSAAPRGSAVVKSAVWAFALHGVLAAVVFTADATPTGRALAGPDALGILMLLDCPVNWAINGILDQKFWLYLPLWWGNTDLTGRTIVALVHVLCGGAFYALVVAGLVALLGWTSSAWFANRNESAGSGPR